MEGLVSLNKLTETVLRDITFMQRPVSILTATSCAQGIKILKEHPDIVVLLFDVALENEPLELDFVNFIRHEQKNADMRILLYLDRSELAPEDITKKNMNIQGYLFKDRYLKEKLLFSVLNEIRNYNEIGAITKNLKSLGGSIAHEMRNPLASISMCCSSLKNRLILYKQVLEKSDYDMCFLLFNAIEKSSRNANFAIDIILQNMKDTDIDNSCFYHFSIAKCIIETIKLYPFFNDKERDCLVSNLQDDFIIWGSEELLQFTLFDLLRNSLSALLSQDKRQITITLEKGDQDNRLIFRDSGRGIAHDKLPYIFDAFVTEGKKGGTGLGLPFCKRTIESFHATISCSSMEGKYTEFILKFPKCSPPKDDLT